MKHLIKLVLGAAVALMATGGLAGSAAATTAEPASTAFTLTSTTTVFTIGAGTSVTTRFSCATSTISGTTPATLATWVQLATTTLTFSDCTGFPGFSPTTVRPSESCSTPAFAPKFHVMGTTPAIATATLTLPIVGPTPCTIAITDDIFGCTSTITFGQTIGNGTTGTGGIAWTNSGAASTLDFNTATIPRIVSPAGPGVCPTAGTNTGTWSGSYKLTSATNVVVTT
jgi:hypothetical protein